MLAFDARVPGYWSRLCSSSLAGRAALETFGCRLLLTPDVLSCPCTDNFLLVTKVKHESALDSASASCCEGDSYSAGSDGDGSEPERRQSSSGDSGAAAAVDGDPKSNNIVPANSLLSCNSSHVWKYITRKVSLPLLGRSVGPCPAPVRVPPLQASPRNPLQRFGDALGLGSAETKVDCRRPHVPVPAGQPVSLWGWSRELAEGRGPCRRATT